ncbi:MAG: DUF3025 domain-containing protein [Candidatus Parcubacteria bacterium]|nr:DUF3025 domain-containing protein [Burkholderiales bacterium]
MAAGVEAHPIYEPVRAWLDRLGGRPTLDSLNSFADEGNLRTESGKPIRFVPPSASDPYYEVQLFETGRVQTRPGNSHDLYNALAWLAFPRTKARINAMHAAEIPRERQYGGGKRGRLRDMLTIFDEGGAIVACSGEVADLVRQARWAELFLERHRELRIVVVGHAVLEQALAPHPGITCKVLFADPSGDLDAQAADWLSTEGKTPRDLPPLPIFGYPGWLAGNGQAAFYADMRYFRPLRKSGHEPDFSAAAR